MELSKLTAVELKDLCRQLQSKINSLEERLNKSWLTKFKEICGFAILLVALTSPVVLGIVTLILLLTNR